jgi:hypothetical protein
VNSAQSIARDDIVPNRYGDAIDGLYRLAAMQQALERYRHTNPPRGNGIAAPSEFFPVQIESLVPEC